MRRSSSPSPSAGHNTTSSPTSPAGSGAQLKEKHMSERTIEAIKTLNAANGSCTIYGDGTISYNGGEKRLACFAADGKEKQGDILTRKVYMQAFIDYADVLAKNIHESIIAAKFLQQRGETTTDMDSMEKTTAKLVDATCILRFYDLPDTWC